MTHQYVIKKVEEAARDSFMLHFDRPPHYDRYIPGQHVRLTVSIGGEAVTRSYSISSSPEVDPHLALTIRHVPEGRLSGYLSMHARAGMEVTLEGPFGRFGTSPDPEQERHLLLFAAGSGITPLYAILRSVLYGEPRSAISLVYANHAVDRIIFMKQLQDLELEFADRFTVYHVISDPTIFPGAERMLKGPLSRLLVRKLTQLLQERHPQQATFYLCGPEGIMQLVENALSSLGFPPSVIFKEYFASNGTAADSSLVLKKLPATHIFVTWQEKRHQIRVPPGTSILQAALQQGLALPHSCKSGLCGKCRASVVSGTVHMQRNSVLTPEELANGQVLLCQGYALSEGVEVRPLTT